MTPEEFRRYGREVVDWIADYIEHVDERPVLSRVGAGEVRGRLPASPPQRPEPFEAVLADLDAVIMPGITHWQSPAFFAYFASNSSLPSILAETLIAGLNVQGMLWQTSPAATELEALVLDWLAEALALPEQFRSTASGGGVIQDTASTSTLCAVVAARERATGGRGNEQGPDGRLTTYASREAHSSVEKAVRIAGMGSANHRRVDVDEGFAMRPDHLAELLAADRAEGRRPAFVCATVGTTSSSALDPLREIGELCREHGAWFHVDAAMAGTAVLCPEHRYIQDGLELADSYTFNPHKWMMTSLDCSALYVAERSALVGALGLTPEYLRNVASESGEVIDYRDWGIALGRRFRALKLWAVIRSYGMSGLQEVIRRHVALAKEFAAWVEGDERFELAAPVPLSLVCFRHLGGDEANESIMERVNATGRAFLTHTRLNDRLTLRLSIMQEKTQREHVARAWDLIREAAGELG
jgi:aromatic-L-amino-acid decarboxylase